MIHQVAYLRDRQFDPMLATGISADLFQGKRFGSVYGALYVGSGGGSSLGPFLSGYLFDRTGGYAMSLAMSVIAALLASGCIWLAAPRRVRQVPGVAARARAGMGVPAPGH
jgi:MFS family permease